MDIEYKDGKLHISGNWNYRRRQYLAKISGLDDKYGLKREFIRLNRTNFSSSGKNAEFDDIVNVNIGEIYEYKSNWEKEYFVVKKNKIENLTYSEVKKILEKEKENEEDEEEKELEMIEDE